MPIEIISKGLELPLIGKSARSVSLGNADLVFDETSFTMKGHLRLTGGPEDAAIARTLQGIFGTLAQELRDRESEKTVDTEKNPDFGSAFD